LEGYTSFKAAANGIEAASERNMGLSGKLNEKIINHKFVNRLKF
jgi:hypothetical protein